MRENIQRIELPICFDIILFMINHEVNTTDTNDQIEESPVETETVDSKSVHPEYATKVDIAVQNRSENPPQEIIDSRFKQSYASRLAEHITGLKKDDPEIIERIIEDQKIIREKYGLPKETKSIPITDYERLLRDIAKKLGVNIRAKSDCGDFFNKTPLAGGVYSGDLKYAGVDIDKETKETYIRSLSTLEHELIHALQHKLSPAMPIELMEYEAYIAGGNTKYLKTNPRAVEVIFGMAIGSSVNHWYKSMSKERSSEVLPEWDNPKFFIEKVDGINSDEIDRYLKIEEIKTELEKPAN